MSKKKRQDRARALQDLHAPASAPAAPIWLAFAAACGLVFAAALAYSNSMQCPFVFDDKYIAENTSIWSLSKIFTEPRNISRPVVSLALALNHAISGTRTWSYHVFNLTTHVLAAWTLFGVLRRTLQTERLRARLGDAAAGLALACALLWALHPLQTQAVTYTIQRAESMMGLFYLLTLYCVIRGHASARRAGWHGAAVFFCALGMACKPVMASAPLVALLYDALFLSGSFPAALRRWKLYAGLAATWIVLAFTLITSPKDTSAGFQMTTITAGEYLFSQPGVILHYLRLAAWPSALCFDYGWPVARTASEIALPLLVILGLLAATAWALMRSPAWGFCGAWFFLILAPTSSIMPIKDLAVEHRMYLPLAAVLTAALCAVFLLLRRLCGHVWPASAMGAKAGYAAGMALAASSAGLLGYQTFQRNKDYATETAIWQDVVNKRPNNERGHYNLGCVLRERDHEDEAMRQFEEAIKIKWAYPEAHSNLCGILDEKGRLEEAVQHGEEALEIRPKYAEAHINLGKALYKQGKITKAIWHYEEALKINPDSPGAHCNLGMALAEQGDAAEAMRHYEQALKLKPDHPEANNLIGKALGEQGMLDEAVGYFQEALRANPRYPEALANLGLVLVRQRKIDEAIKRFEEALKIKPTFADAHYNWGAALKAQGDDDGAMRHYEEALKLNPEYPGAHVNLGNLLSARGKKGDAIRHYEEALKIKPGYAAAQFNLALAFIAVGKLNEAKTLFENLLAASPNDADAHFTLGQILEHQGTILEAVAHFRKAVQLRPDFPAAQERAQHYKNVPDSH